MLGTPDLSAITDVHMLKNESGFAHSFFAPSESVCVSVSGNHVFSKDRVVGVGILGGGSPFCPLNTGIEHHLAQGRGTCYLWTVLAAVFGGGCP